MTAKPGGWKTIDGRWIALLMAAAWSCILLFMLRYHDPQDAWNWFGVPDLGARFPDLDIFPAAQGAMEHGVTPYRRLAADPWHRVFNYPPLWLSFMHFGPDAIPWVGAGIAVAWLAALLGQAGRLTLPEGCVVGALICSPCAVLGMERGNVDLLIFSGVVLALWALRRGWTAPAWSGLMLASLLKLFPVFAFTAFVRLGWRRALEWWVMGAGAFGLLLALQWPEIQLAVRATPAEGLLSYGSTASFHALRLLDPTSYARIVEGAVSVPLMLMLLAGALVGSAFLHGLCRPQPMDPRASAELDAFRAGSAIFLATFLCGTHYAYRLVFLFMCVPWLLRRPFRTHGANTVARCMVLLILFICWINPLWQIELTYVRHGMTWVLAALLAWCAGYTLPRVGTMAGPAR